LAVADNVLFGRTSWNGQPIDTTTIIGKYTFLGDANLDGQVTTDDYVVVDLGLGRTNAQWIQGDTDFSGIVTTDDYVVIDLNLGKGTSNPLAWADDQEAMIALHGEKFADSYVKAVKNVGKGIYQIGLKGKGGGKSGSRS
jgi:hypothetical protein